MNKSQKSKNDKYKTDSSDKIDRTSIRIGKTTGTKQYITTGTTIRLKRTITLWSNTTSSHVAFVRFTKWATAFNKNSGKPHLPKSRSDQ